jgi:hypothetical protein
MTSIRRFLPYQLVYKGPAGLSLLKVSYFRRHFALQLSFQGPKALFPAILTPIGPNSAKNT